MLTKNNEKICKILRNGLKRIFTKPLFKFLIEDFHFGHLFYVQFQNSQPILFQHFVNIQRKTI